MHPTIRKNNVLASNLYFASCFFALIRNGLNGYDTLISKSTEAWLIVLALAAASSLFGLICYLFGIGMRRGVMWVKIYFLTAHVLAALAYVVNMLSDAPASIATRQYNTPLKASVLAIEYFLSLWAVLVICQGFGSNDRVLKEALEQPATEEAPDARVADEGYNRLNG